MHLKIHRASLYIYYSWKESYVSNWQHFFTKTRLEDIDLSKTQPCKYFVYIIMDRGNPIEDWGVNYTNSKLYTVTLYDCNHLAHIVKVLWQIQKFMSYCTAFASFLFWIWWQSSSEYIRPGDCIWRGDLLEVFLHYDFGGLTFGGAYRWRGLLIGILRGSYGRFQTVKI